MFHLKLTRIRRNYGHHYRYLINKLQGIKVVGELNREFVLDILQSIVEIVIYGDQHNPSIFECFMEYQILAEFLRLLNVSRNSRIEAQLLHYLSIMIQNLNSEHSIYYCFSNEYINNIILHKYEFDVGDLASYYVSFLRTVSDKVNRDTICLLVKVHDDRVVSFPLYTEAIKFAQHEEKMIQIAVRALTLGIYHVSDDMVYAFITTPPVSEYFSELVLNLRQHCFSLDALVNATKDSFTLTTRKGLLMEVDKIMDDLYYCNDILSVNDYRLSRLMTHTLLSLLVLPILLPPLQSYQGNGSQISIVSSLYIVSRLIQIVNAKEVVNFVAVALLYPHATLSMSKDRSPIKKENNSILSLEHLNEFEECLMSIINLEPRTSEDGMMKHMFGHLSEHKSCSCDVDSIEMDDGERKRGGILSLIFSGNHTIFLASLMMLFIISESTGIDDSLNSMLGLAHNKIGMEQINVQAFHIDSSNSMDQNVFMKHIPKILCMMLNFLVSEMPCSTILLWNTGWVLQKLLVCQEKKLEDHDFDLFNKSYEKSCERLLKEVIGCWFDYVPVTLKNEWENCRAVLEESSQLKDPVFAFETALDKYIPDGDISSYLSWQRMVHAVQVFVLHHLVKAFILEGDFPENPLLHVKSSLMSISGRTPGSDVHSVNFVNGQDLGSGIPCKISFAKGKENDVYMIPRANGISGKLLLVEKHPHHTEQGVIIAVAPLVGLNPRVDEKHPTWLHLQIREYDPELEASKSSRYHSYTSDDHVIDRKWTLGFPNSESCEAARLVIVREISKLRSGVERLLAPLLESFAKTISSGDDGDAYLA